MNEADTRAQYIDPQLASAGWGGTDGSKVFREFRITDGRIQIGGKRAKPDIADYVLEYQGEKLAVIEAKRADLSYSEGVAQAKQYAEKLQTPYAYASNGTELYEIVMRTGEEKKIDTIPTPEELWNRLYSHQDEWRHIFRTTPFEDIGGTKKPRYYQENAVHAVLDNIASEKDRILLTLATGTGKTYIAFQIAWKLFHTRWNINRDGNRRPRILFLADRNILADQAFNSFSAFDEDALIRINPGDIRRRGNVPTNGSIFFTIFQTFMSGPNDTAYYGEYEPDFFDCIIIDECHRGGANDESTWRGILEHFSPAVQIGLTATPKRKDNVDTYDYFGEPVYTYSLKSGINDGFLTPFKVKRIQTTLDEYVYTSDDEIVEGEIETGKVYTEEHFNRIIEIKAREEKRVRVFLDLIHHKEKTIVFCATQEHAAAVRDLINQYADSTNPLYCARVTANDGALGEQHLRDFQDNEKTIPTILTTSQKLSTGVDARNVRNIVLMRPVNSMIEFKQIVGRGTRLFEGKEYFTIYDFVGAYKHFNDPEWDGEPLDNTTEKTEKKGVIKAKHTENIELKEDGEKQPRPKKIKVKLRDGKTREIQHMVQTSFWSADGTPMSAEEFLEKMFGDLPDFFKSEEELRAIWSDPKTRKAFLEKIATLGYGKEQLEDLQQMIDAEDSDLYDVLAYVSFASAPISRRERVADTREAIFKELDDNAQEFIRFVLEKYVDDGVEELDEQKLPDLLRLKYHAMADAEQKLGSVSNIRGLFFGFQKFLYTKSVRKNILA